jgi:cytochrome c biogenesis factor
LADLGAIVVLAAFVVAAFGVAASIVGHLRGISPLIISGQRAALSVSLLAILATAALIYSFVTDDFTVAYVAQRSSYETDLPLKVVPY